MSPTAAPFAALTDVRRRTATALRAISVFTCLGAATVAGVLVATAALPSSLHAQMGSTTDIITGTVTTPDGRPLANARVEVMSLETQTTRSRATNDKGQYTVLFPDGGGQYRVTVRSVGFAPATFVLARQADEDRLVGNVRLTTVPQQLAAVEVRASAVPQRGERPEPGSTERVTSGEQLQRLPIDAGDPTAIAGLSPGVVTLTPSDTAGGGFSVAGQRPDLNNVTLDGASFGASGVPAEAVRNTRVITSTYDIARGQFTGGQVATTTRGGTNQVTGAFTYQLRDPRLGWEDASQPGAFNQEFTQHQLSGGIGGPIARDKAFYFAAVQLRRRTDPMQSLLAADPRSLQRLGVSATNVDAFLGELDARGIPRTLAGIPDERQNDNGTVILRLDYQLTDDHSVTLRGDYRRALNNAFRLSALAVPSQGGEQESSGGGVMLSTSSVVQSFLNELRIYYNRSDSDASPFLRLPEGRVRVASVLEDGARSVSTLGFGGNNGLPQQSASDMLELKDELSWLSGGGAHRFKIGTLLNLSGFTGSSNNNRLGSFSFNSLDDFRNSVPAQYTRSLTGSDRRGGAAEGAFYLGDSWRRDAALQVTYGLRAEGSMFRGEPAFNPEIERLFGRRTDDFPRDVRVSPRVGFTWNLGGNQQQGGPGAQAGQGGAGGAGGGGRGGFGGGGGGPRGGGGGFPASTRGIIRGGIGEFRGRTPTGLFSSAMDATGLATGETQLVCVGDAVPMPDWSGYLSGTTPLPTECVGGGTGDPGFSTRRPAVTVFEPGFGAPRSWRASLGFSKRFLQRYQFSVDGSYALGTNLYGVRDLNLRTDVDANGFRLPAEGDRPVFAPASSIIPATGATTVLASRVHPEYAQVLEVHSGLQSRTSQMVLSVGGLVQPGIFVNGSYTLSRTVDQSSFSGGGGFGGGSGFGGSALSGYSSPTTAGDPNTREFARSDFDRRHTIITNITWPARQWMDLSVIGRVVSGAPYTPRVGGDINGDGSRNDRAFVFDPAVAAAEGDAELSAAMQRLLSSASGDARRCLEKQLGTIAGRNSCSAGWLPSLDLQANFRPSLGKTMGRRLQVSLTTVNLLTGVDRLLHGSDGMRGWGQSGRTDPTLLYVRGFDPATMRYRYQVNERFGRQGAQQSFLAPFQIGLQARLQVGPDRQREQMLAMVRGLRGDTARAPRTGGIDQGGPGGPGGPGGFNFRELAERSAPNPAPQVLALGETLRLSPQQVEQIQAIGDSVTARREAMFIAIADELQRSSDPGAMFRNLQPRLEAVRGISTKALSEIQGVLTPAQWTMLPENVKNPPQQGPARRGQGQGQEGGRQRQAQPGQRPPA